MSAHCCPGFCVVSFWSPGIPASAGHAIVLNVIAMMAPAPYGVVDPGANTLLFQPKPGDAVLVTSWVYSLAIASCSTYGNKATNQLYRLLTSGVPLLMPGGKLPTVP